MLEFSEALADLEKWGSGKGLLVYGNGEDFCSGGDRDTMYGIANEKKAKMMSEFMHQNLLKLRNLPLLTGCVVHGRAIGGGAELTASTDFRLFTSSGIVMFVQARMGVVSGWGGGTMLSGILGYPKALNIFTTCDKITADTAERIGYSSATVCDSEKGITESEKWLSFRTRHSQQVIRGFKSILLNAQVKNLEESLKLERDIFTPIFEGPTSHLAAGTKVKHN